MNRLRGQKSARSLPGRTYSNGMTAAVRWRGVCASRLVGIGAELHGVLCFMMIFRMMKLTSFLLR